MDKISATRLLLATLVAMLAGCAAAPPEAPAAGTTAPQRSAFRPGVGVVESASVVALSSSTPTMAYRVQMPDGTSQNVVQAGERFRVGERAEVTSEGRLVRP